MGINRDLTETVITSEEIFDEDKFVLDEVDKQRIEKNIETLKKDNIPVLEYMRTVPINSITVIKSKEEILDKVIVDYTLATCALYMLTGSSNLVSTLLDKLDDKYDIRTRLSLEDKATVVDIVNNNILANGLEDITKKYEGVAVCLWALGFMNRPSSNEKCDIKEINKILFKVHDYSDLLFKAKVRPKEEILDFADLVSRYFWAVREIKSGNGLDKLDPDIVEVQNETLDFITSYCLDSLAKEKLKVICEKNDLKFELTIPSYLKFEKVGEGSKELVAFKNDNGDTRIVIQDLGPIEELGYEASIAKYTKMFRDNRFNIIETHRFDSSFLEDEITQLVIEREDYALNVYFVYISHHLLRLDSLINKNTNYHNYTDNLNSKNTNIDLDILFSIKDNND